MQRVSSADGTMIAFERQGTGRPLLLLHGTSGDRNSFAPLLPFVTSSFACITMDRRGRGDSGDHTDYSLEKEFDDAAAVAQAAGPEIDIFGHSYGALCAVEAAPRITTLRRLVLLRATVLDAGGLAQSTWPR